MVDGLTLDQWLATTFTFENRIAHESITPEFNHALQKLGTNALPHLLSKLQIRRLPRERMIAKWIAATPNPQGVANLVGLNRWYIEGQRAVYGFRALGSLATNSLPEILAMPPTGFTMHAIAAMGNAALPILHAATQNGPDQVKSNAMSALESSEYDFKREQIVEIWIECLADPSPSIRLHAIRLLSQAKPIRAQAAIKPLEDLSNEPDPEVASAATSALVALQAKR